MNSSRRSPPPRRGAQHELSQPRRPPRSPPRPPRRSRPRPPGSPGGRRRAAGRGGRPRARASGARPRCAARSRRRRRREPRAREVGDRRPRPRRPLRPPIARQRTDGGARLAPPASRARAPRGTPPPRGRRGSATPRRRGSRASARRSTSASTPSGLNVTPAPAVSPPSLLLEPRHGRRPSERSASCHSPCPPRRTTAKSSVVSCRVQRSPVRHGASPAAAASAGRQTSPPTMQRPVRTVVDDPLADRGRGRARRAPAEDRGDEREERDVLGGGLAGVVAGRAG